MERIHGEKKRGREAERQKEREARGREAERQRNRDFFSVSCFFVSCFFASLLLLPCSRVFANPSKEPLKAQPPAMMTPTQAIKDLDNMVNQYKVGKNLTEADKELNRQLKQKMLRGTFDLKELGKLALDKYWNQRTPKEQGDFIELLTNLLEERSVFSKERAVEKGQSQPYTIHYKGDVFQNKEKTDCLSKTVIRIKNRDIKVDLNYRLKKVPFGWKIYDVIMDDASLVENYRYSFGNIISKDGYPELVRRMQNKLAEFRAKRS